MSIPSFWVSLFRAFKSRRMSRSNTAIRTKRVARMQPRTVLQKVVLWIFPTRREYKMLFNKRHVLKKQATPKQRAFQRLAPKKQVWGIILYINDALNCTSRHLPSETICMLFCTFLRAEAGTTLGIFAPHMDPRRRNMNEAFVRWAQPMPSKMRLQILSLRCKVAEVQSPGRTSTTKQVDQMAPCPSALEDMFRTAWAYLFDPSPALLLRYPMRADNQ